MNITSIAFADSAPYHNIHVKINVDCATQVVSVTVTVNRIIKSTIDFINTDDPSNFKVWKMIQGIHKHDFSEIEKFMAFQLQAAIAIFTSNENKLNQD